MPKMGEVCGFDADARLAPGSQSGPDQEAVDSRW